MSFYVATASGNLRLGIYTDNAGNPGTLVTPTNGTYHFSFYATLQVATPTATNTLVPATNTPTKTLTPSNTPVASNTSTKTPTPSNTPVVTNTFTKTPTPSNTPVATSTFTKTPTPSNTPVVTNTFTKTPTPSSTPTATQTPGTPTAPPPPIFSHGIFSYDGDGHRVKSIMDTNIATSTTYFPSTSSGQALARTTM